MTEPTSQARVVLGLDTSHDVRVGVAVDGIICGRQFVADSRQHVEQLIPLTRQALSEAGVTPADLTGVAVGLGPGPFTGLRVGIVAAQVLAQVQGIPLHGVCSLDIVARELVDTAATDPAALADDFLVVSDARRKEVYWARYSGAGVRLGEPGVGAPETLPELPVGGPGVAAYAERLGARRHLVGGDHVDGGLLALLYDQLPSAGVEPLYLRRPDATEPTRHKSTLMRGRRIPFDRLAGSARHRGASGEGER